MTSRTLHTAEILLPMGGAELIVNGGVVVDESGVVVEVGPVGDIRSAFDSRSDHQVLLPGVLNCHVHLTDARRESPVGGGAGLNSWVRELLATRSADDGADGQTSLDDAVADVLGTMRDAGTVAVGEVVNNLATLDAIGRSGMRCRLIRELLSFRSERASAVIDGTLEQGADTAWPENVQFTLAAHAPYSVSIELLRRIDAWSARTGAFFHQHLAEDPDERLLFEEASGPWRAYLEAIGAWDSDWTAREMSPIALYDKLGLLSDRFIAVHLADATPDEIGLLASRGVRAILSPSSNLHITGKLPPLGTIAASGMLFAFGTDGRGSNASLDVFSEAQCLIERWPDLRPGILLEGLTSAGAAILQFDDLGIIRPGARPGLLAVELDHADGDLRRLERAIVASDPGSRTLV